MTDKTLDVIFPDALELSLNGHSFKIEPFKFGMLKHVTAVVGDLINPILAIAQAGSKDPRAILGLYTTGGAKFEELMARLINVDYEFIENLKTDEATELIFALITVNYGFFVQTLTPLIQEKAERLLSLTQTQ